MKYHAFIAVLAVLLTGAFCASGSPALAGDAAAPQAVASVAPGNATKPVTAQNMPVYLDEALASKHADFSSFAKTRVSSLNRNHIHAKSRMQITKQSDGSYRARYHQIDAATVSCKVSRSSSKVVPFVAVLRFQEMIMEAVAESPEACRQAQFAAVEVIPNRQIFSFKKGGWE